MHRQRGEVEGWRFGTHLCDKSLPSAQRHKKVCLHTLHLPGRILPFRHNATAILLQFFENTYNKTLFSDFTREIRSMAIYYCNTSKYKSTLSATYFLYKTHFFFIIWSLWPLQALPLWPSEALLSMLRFFYYENIDFPS